jgi:regulator of RNase E activity RraA
MAESSQALTHAELLQLKRWNTPTIYNGWEQITRHDAAHDGFNLEETRDFMPHMGPMVGYALTLSIQPGNESTPSDGWDAYYEFVAAACGPNIVVVSDLDKPATFGSFWGEVNSNIHRSLGCVGTITDGAIRDVDEMTNAGFKALARRLCVGHAHARPVAWGQEVEVFGTRVCTGDLIHADRHGFLVIPPEDQPDLLHAATFMDQNECRTVIDAARNNAGQSFEAILKALKTARQEFRQRALEEFGSRGEW